jgi:hypothetical protein
MLTRNESSSDRIVRIALGVLLGYISLSQTTGLTQSITLIIAGILLFTGITGFCGLYALLGISTCKNPA